MRTEWFKPKLEHQAQDEEQVVDPFANADIALTRACGATLEQHYPGHPWLIEASHQQGVVYISIPVFTGRNKYVLHINVLKTDPGLRHVIRAGGEILERFKIPRQRFSVDNYVNALNAMPIHLRGRGMRELN